MKKAKDSMDEKIALKSIFFSSLTNPTTRFINNLIYAVVGLMGGIFAIGGMVTVGGFVSFLAYSNQYTKPFNEISGVTARDMPRLRGKNIRHETRESDEVHSALPATPWIRQCPLLI